ncbi:hypothetical protein PENTCL1PPCAC_21399, partial [Pristionchus entomophagus]
HGNCIKQVMPNRNWLSSFRVFSRPIEERVITRGEESRSRFIITTSNVFQLSITEHSCAVKSLTRSCHCMFTTCIDLSRVSQTGKENNMTLFIRRMVDKEIDYLFLLNGSGGGWARLILRNRSRIGKRRVSTSGRSDFIASSQTLQLVHQRGEEVSGSLDGSLSEVRL